MSELKKTKRINKKKTEKRKGISNEERAPKSREVEKVKFFIILT